MLKLGLCSERYLREKLRELLFQWPKPLIACLKYGRKGGGRRPFYYYLTDYGKTITHKSCLIPKEKIKTPGKHPQIERDYVHRFQHLDFLVSLLIRTKKNGLHVEFFDHYFDWEKGSNKINQLHSLTRIQLPCGVVPAYVEPDGAFVLHTPIGKKLYLFEMHR